MPDNGQRSTDLDTLSFADDLLGNAGGDIGRLPFSRLRDSVADYDDVAVLRATAETARGEGALWSTKDGFRFLEADPGATDHDLVTTGGGAVKLYVADDVTDATAVGAQQSEAPGSRPAAAPALVASMQRRRKYGVSNRDLLGRRYNPVNDASVALNGFLGELAADGITLNDPDNLVATLETGLIVPARMKMTLGPNSRFRRAFEGSQAHTLVTDQSDDVSLNVTVTTGSGVNIGWTDATQTLAHGDEVVLLGWEPEYGLNGRRTTVIKSGTSYTVPVVQPSEMSAGATGRVVRIAMHDGIEISGGVLDCATTDDDGPGVSIYGDGTRIVGLRADRIEGGFLKVLGDDIQLDLLRCLVAESKGQGAFGIRWLGGRRFKCSNADVFCGDDVYQYVPSTAPADPAFDYPCEEGLFVNCTGRSYSARLMVAGQGGAQSGGAELQMYGHMRNLGWIGVKGFSGNRGMNLKANRSKAPMDRIYVRDCVIDGTYDDGSNADLINIVADVTNGGNIAPGLQLGGFGSVLLDNVVTKNNPLGRGIDIQDNTGTTGARFVIRDCEVEGSAYPFFAESIDTLIIDGLKVRGKGGAVTNGIQLGSNGRSIRHVEVRRVEVEGLTTNANGIRFSSVGEVAEVQSIRAMKEAGSTATSAIEVAAGVVNVGNVGGDVDDEITGSGRVVWAPTTRNVDKLLQQFSGNQTVNPNHTGRTHWWIAGSPVLTVPDDATDATIPLGFEAVYFNRGGGTVTITPGGAATVEGRTSLTSDTGCKLKKIAADTWLSLVA
jgi:hypothetical protein